MTETPQKVLLAWGFDQAEHVAFATASRDQEHLDFLEQSEQKIADTHVKDGDHVLGAANGTGESGPLAVEKYPFSHYLTLYLLHAIVSLYQHRRKA